MTINLRKLGLLLFAAAAAAPGFADAPNLITYQGRLQENGGLVTGTRTIRLDLCDDLAVGAPDNCVTVYNTGTSVANGIFKATFGAPASVNLQTGVWYVEVYVAGNALVPREQLASSPYAQVASSVAASGLKAGMVGAGVHFSSYLGVGTSSPGTSRLFVQASVGDAHLVKVASQNAAGIFLVDRTGNVGIGTTTPVDMLQLVGSGTQIPRIRQEAYGAANFPDIMGHRARGSLGGESPVQAGDVLMAMRGSGWGTSGFWGPRSALLLKAAETWTDAVQGAYVGFLTTPIGSNVTAETMRVNTAGGVSIGAGYAATNSPINGMIVQGNSGIGTTSPTSRLQVAGGDLGLGDGSPAGNQPVTVWMTNKHGSTLSAGDIVIVDSANDNSFIAIGTDFHVRAFGVVYDATINNNAVGRVAVYGVVPVNCAGNTITRGDFVTTSTTVAEARSSGSNAGSIGLWLEGGACGTTMLAILK